MNFIEDLRVGEERLEAGFSAEIDRPAAIVKARKIRGIGVAQDPSAEGDKARMVLLLEGVASHAFTALA